MIFIEKSKKIPIYVQIYRELRRMIISGQLTPGTKLESVRALSQELNVSINTVKNAYHQLVVEGFVENKPKSGYVVINIKKYQPKLPVTSISIPIKKEQVECETYKYDFTYQKMSMELFDVSKWRRYISDALLGYDVQKLGQYNTQKGEIELREEIKRYLEVSRDVHCEIEQIVVCSGIQDSIERICRILQPTKVGVECPGISLWTTIFRAFRYEVVPLSVYPKFDYIEELNRSGAEIVVTTPSHQFPTGYTMSLKERMELLQWGASGNRIIIEDDYDCEFRYNSQPISAIQSMDEYDCVLYMGTFSKILLPGLRINFMVLPKKMLEPYERIYKDYPCGISWLEQKTLYNFMCNDDFSKYIRKARHSFKEKYYELINICRLILGNGVEIIGTDAGLHILIKVIKANNQDELIERAKAKGVKVYSVKEYWKLKNSYPQNILLLGFAFINKNDILDGIRLLKEAWQEYL